MGKKGQSVVRGMPSAVLLSIAVHAALFFLAGMLVVFTVVKKKEIEFEPPKAVERPKMKLKKPKPRIKKSSRPKKAQHILAKVDPVNMPEIQLPELSGMGGDGLGEGIVGGFDTLPDLSEPTLFGSSQSIGNDLVGTFYDFKRNGSGRGIPMSDHQFVEELTKFAKSGWKPSALAKFYRAPKKLYATTIMMPPVRSSVAPAAFGEADTIGYAWMVHYKGQLVHKDGIRFRFWGNGDDVLIVRVDGAVVLNASWPDEGRGTERIVSWRSRSAKSRQYFLGSTSRAVVGDWITLEPGVPKNLEVMLGEVPGGAFCAMLVVEVDGVEYERNRQGMPILPIFKTVEPSWAMVDAIAEHLVPDEVSMSGGPVFCDYASALDPGGVSGLAEEEVNEVPDAELSNENAMRQWTIESGKIIEAEFVVQIAENVVLRNGRGKIIKVPVGRFSSVDREYIELANPPELNIDFIKRSSQRILPVTPYLPEFPPRVLDYVFGAKVRKTSKGSYDHKLTMEYFALGMQRLDDQKYKLLDRKSDTFVLSAENEFSHRFSGDPVELISYELYNSYRGLKYAENLIVVTDERGKIIQYSTSSKWLFENLEKLRELPVGAFLDDTGSRVHPTGPKSVFW